MTGPEATLVPAVASPAAAPPRPAPSAAVREPSTGGNESATPSWSAPNQAVPDAAPLGVSPSEHEAHHR